jgi:hypothetical protein
MNGNVWPHLSPRESAVVRLSSRGWTDKEIARVLMHRGRHSQDPHVASHGQARRYDAHPTRELRARGGRRGGGRRERADGQTGRRADGQTGRKSLSVLPLASCLLPLATKSPVYGA